jgi:hypothetical protein
MNKCLWVVRWILGDSRSYGVALCNFYVFIVLKVHNLFVAKRSRANHCSLLFLFADGIEHV